MNQYLNEYRKNHPEYRAKAREYAKRYRKEHPEVKKKWLEQNPTYHLEYNREYRKQNPEKQRQKKIRYRLRHPDRVIASNRMSKQKIKSRLLYYTPNGRKIDLKKVIRTGYCSLCPNNIHDKTCKKTHIHHIEYHDDDVLKDTIEICVSCHTKETWKQRRKVYN